MAILMPLVSGIASKSSFAGFFIFSHRIFNTGAVINLLSAEVVKRQKIVVIDYYIFFLKREPKRALVPHNIIK